MIPLPVQGDSETVSADRIGDGRPGGDTSDDVDRRGVAADTEVENFPREVIAGRDPHRERTVQEAMRLRAASFAAALRNVTLTVQNPHGIRLTTTPATPIHGCAAATCSAVLVEGQASRGAGEPGLLQPRRPRYCDQADLRAVLSLCPLGVVAHSHWQAMVAHRSLT